MECFWTTLPPIMIWMLVLLISISLNTVVLSALIHHLIIFHCPQLIWILFVFLPRIHCNAPRWSTFQGVSRNVDVILVKDFANSIDVLLVWQSSLFWNQISYFNDHVYSSLIVEMKSERCQFWKVFLEIKLLWSKTQPTLFNVVLWLSCISKTEIDPLQD